VRRVEIDDIDDFLSAVLVLWPKLLNSISMHMLLFSLLLHYFYYWTFFVFVSVLTVYYTHGFRVSEKLFLPLYMSHVVIKRQFYKTFIKKNWAQLLCIFTVENENNFWTGVRCSLSTAVFCFKQLFRYYIVQSYMSTERPHTYSNTQSKQQKANIKN